MPTAHTSKYIYPFCVKKKTISITYKNNTPSVVEYNMIIFNKQLDIVLHYNAKVMKLTIYVYEFHKQNQRYIVKRTLILELRHLLFNRILFFKLRRVE